MPYAVTHVLLTIIAVDLFRDYAMKKHKKYLTLHTLFIAGVAGLLPDIDIPLGWVLKQFGITLVHGSYTHAPVWGLLFLIPGYYFFKKGKHKTGTIFFVISFGILFHLFLDFLLGGGMAEGVMMFWPFSRAVFKIHLLSYIPLSNVSPALDAIILLGWLWHEEVKHKIKDYI